MIIINPDFSIWNTTVTCELHTGPVQGNVTYKTDGAVTTAEYTCGDMYSLAGPESRVCQENGNWSDTLPTCSKFTQQFDLFDSVSDN